MATRMKRFSEADTLLEGMLIAAHGDDEQLWALREGIEDGLDLPMDVHVVGELSLGADFEGVLAWGLIDNRPFLRCMQGYGLCLWRLKRWEEAEQVFTLMLWMNQSDNQGNRFLLPDVRARLAWVDDED